jgi:hypothetical protein
MPARLVPLLAAVLIVLPTVAQNDLGTIKGRVQDITAAGIRGVGAELKLESNPQRVLYTKTDVSGRYKFEALQEGDYTLRLTSAGFSNLTVKAIRVSKRQQLALPDLMLSIGSSGCGSDHAVLEYIRILPSGVETGNLGGTV